MKTVDVTAVRRGWGIKKMVWGLEREGNELWETAKYAAVAITVTLLRATWGKIAREEWPRFALGGQPGRAGTGSSPAQVAPLPVWDARADIGTVALLEESVFRPDRIARSAPPVSAFPAQY